MSNLVQDDRFERDRSLHGPRLEPENLVVYMNVRWKFSIIAKERMSYVAAKFSGTISMIEVRVIRLLTC